MQVIKCFGYIYINQIIMSKNISFVLTFILLLYFCYGSDVFHEDSKITFNPSYPAGLFGYAVAFNGRSLVVGAPKATINITRPIATGVAFYCDLQNLLKSNVSCTPLSLRNRKFDGQDLFKNGMWFGASIAAGPTGKVIICAPRWQMAEWNYLAMNGICYVDMKRNKRFIRAPNRNGHAGMAAKVAADHIILGAPGLFQWSGGIMKYTIDSNVNSITLYDDSLYSYFRMSGTEPDEYFGYSVESGIFEDGGKTLFVTGGPRGKGGYGEVLVLELTPTGYKIVIKLEGPQLGSYFGASLSCLDINGDGRTDLLVGAPNYVKWFDRDALYDQGAVYVYINKEQLTGFTLEYAGHVTGSEENGARFGYAISDMEDIDGDGYSDVAVSAPWENNGAGVVYLYAGDKNGLKNQYVQRIEVSEARGFGMGLTRGHDFDSNQCNDLIVGAPDSTSVYIFRCIPTVKVQTKIIIPEALYLPENTSNFTAEFCIVISSRSIHRMIITEFDATITIDPESSRARIIGDSKYKVSARLKNDNCMEKIIEIKPGADLSKPISISFDVALASISSMKDNSTQFSPSARRVAEDSNLHSEYKIQLMRDCGEDLICTPKLEMSLDPMHGFSKQPYTPGLGQQLGAIIKVINMGEPAFGVHVNLTLPSPPKRVPKTCDLRGLDMTCDLPSPLNRNESVEWEVEIEYSGDIEKMDVVMIEASIDDSVANLNVSDNASQYLEIKIERVANIIANGKTFPNATISVSRDRLTEGRGIYFVHNFQIINTGPSDLPDLSARIIMSEEVTLLSTNITGCQKNWESGALALECSWSMKAQDSVAVELLLRLNLATNGKCFEANATCNVTTCLLIDDQDINVSIISVLVLEPAPVIWISLAVGIVGGLLLLAIITYGMHKTGCFSRNRPDYKKLRNEILEQPSCSNGYKSSHSCPESLPEDSNVESPGNSAVSSKTPLSSQQSTASDERDTSDDEDFSNDDMRMNTLL